MLARSAVRTLRPGAVRRFATAAVGSIEQHDIVIIGGGPAGLALAAALSASELVSSTNKITLLEGSNLDKVANWSLPPSEYSNRVSSITADNIEFLRSIGAWQHLDLSRARPIEGMQVWDGISNSRITFDSPYSDATDEIQPMATLVENMHLQRGILASLRQRGVVEIIDGSRVLKVKEGEGCWPVVELEGGRSLRARLLIGADGYNSPVKAYSNIESFGWAYDRNGVVASVQVSPSNGGLGMTTAWQRFLPEGPVAFLPMSDTTASLVWSTTPAIANALRSISIELLPSLVNYAFSLPYSSLSPLFKLLTSTPAPSPATLAQALLELAEQHPETFSVDDAPDPLPPLVIAVQPGSVASFPLKLMHVDSYVGLPRGGKDVRTALVGDAAHTVHPMAGQGLNMGLGDVRGLLSTLEGIVQAGGDVGSYNALRPYPRSRYLANHAVLSTTDHLSTLYSSQLAPIVWARSTGLEIINELDSVKAAIMGGAGAGGGVGPSIDGLVKGVGMLGGLGKMLMAQAASALRR